MQKFVPNCLLRPFGEHGFDAVRDTRYAVRLLARAPGFTAAAVVCLAIGTGLTAAMFARYRYGSDVAGEVGREPGRAVTKILVGRKSHRPLQTQERLRITNAAG